ncbi:MAG: hypothetical protein M0R03_23490 [Novosphingobium sp.]|jgi:hypothetical protein|nr:hypothetical protein [Novosphingobium sp.]
MAKKYIVYPGMVKSKADNRFHEIGFTQLCKLYNVNLDECINGRFEDNLKGIDRSKYGILTVRYDGNYCDLSKKE